MNNWIHLLFKFKQDKKPVALITVTKVLGSAPCKVASKMIVTKDRELYGTIGGGKLEYTVINEAITAIKNQQVKTFSYTLGPDFEQCCGGKVEVLIEPMNKTPDLYIFGAGHIGVALSNLLKNSPFSVNLFDTRKNWKETLNLNPHVSFFDTDFDLYKHSINWGENCFIVIVTHDHKLDFEITALALSEKTKYIGLIGSKTKRNKFNNKLKSELGFENGIIPVHCPVGLDIGGTSPEEIAISIAAELLKTYYEK